MKLRALWILLLFMLLALNSVTAKDSYWYAGISSSSVDPVDFEQNAGITVGYSNNLRLFKSLYFVRDFNLSYKRTQMVNKVGFNPYDDLSSFDIQANFLYYQGMIALTLDLPVGQNSLKIYGGPSAMICLSDDVNPNKVKVLDDSDGLEYRRDLDYDFMINRYEFWDIPLFRSSTWAYCAGIRLGIWKGQLDFRYTHSKLRKPEGYEFFMDFHTIEMLVGF